MNFLSLFFILLIIYLVLGLIFQILFSPIFWIIMLLFIGLGSFRRYLYQKQVEKYNQEFNEELRRKKEAYQARSNYEQGSDDIIDVNYTERDD